MQLLVHEFTYVLTGSALGMLINENLPLLRVFGCQRRPDSRPCEMRSMHGR